MKYDVQSFGLQAHLDHLYTTQPRRLALRADTPAAFRRWQQELRVEIVRLLGLAGRPALPPPDAQKLGAQDRGDYLEELHSLDVGEQARLPVYLLRPKTKPPWKPVIVFHGHDPSVQYILGNYPDAETARQQLARDGNYAQALARQGYLVCAPEQRGFGQRVSEQAGCRHLAFSYLMEGRTLLGERCRDGMQAIDWLLQRDDVLPGVLGATGNSGGGTTTLWLAAIEERITVALPSCYFCSFRASILGMRHCECNYVPGILELAEMGELAALLAPRPLRVIAGERDPIFPIAGVREQYRTAERAWALADAPERLSLAVHPGEHAYHHASSHDWFRRWL